MTGARQSWVREPYRFAQAAANAVAHDGIADFFGDGEAKARGIVARCVFARSQARLQDKTALMLTAPFGGVQKIRALFQSLRRKRSCPFRGRRFGCHCFHHRSASAVEAPPQPDGLRSIGDVFWRACTAKEPAGEISSPAGRARRAKTSPSRGRFIARAGRARRATASGRKALAAAGAASGDDLAAADRFHTGAEAVAALAHDLAGLISPLHGSAPVCLAACRRLGRRLGL